MRFITRQQIRRLCWIAAFVIVVLTGLSVYVIATRDPISIHGFQRLRPDMTRAEVERLLGSPAGSVQALANAPDALKPDALKFVSVITYTATPVKLGGLTGKVLLKSTAEARLEAEQHTWDGREGRIRVVFDGQERVTTIGFAERATWRHQLEEWLPWLR